MENICNCKRLHTLCIWCHYEIARQDCFTDSHIDCKLLIKSDLIYCVWVSICLHLKWFWKTNGGRFHAEESDEERNTNQITPPSVQFWSIDANCVHFICRPGKHRLNWYIPKKLKMISKRKRTMLATIAIATQTTLRID